VSSESGPWRPAFLEALKLLAKVSEAMDRRGLPRPVLVGGGAAEYYSGSALMTGDIDVTSPVQPELEEESEAAGFVPTFRAPIHSRTDPHGRGTGSASFRSLWRSRQRLSWNREFVMKQPANMVSKSSKPEQVVDMAEFGRELIRRRAELGNPELPRNSGKRRTASKRALLKAIEKAGGRW
jgi:hypothetical protein